MGTILLFFGPVSSASRTNTPGENIALGIFFLLVLCLGLLETLRSRRRVEALRKAVLQRNWTWFGTELPPDFPLPQLVDVSNHFVKVQNVFWGRQRDISFLAFDCVFRGSKTHYLVSTIAARASKNPFGAEVFDPELSVTEANGWFAIQRTQQADDKRFSVEEFLAQIDSLK